MPDDIKAEVDAKASELVETFLKPTYIKPPPKDQRWNYIIDLFTKWHRSFFYFCSTYACPGPNALSPTFESRFARMEYVGEGRFNLAYLPAHRQMVGGLPEAHRQGMPGDDPRWGDLPPVRKGTTSIVPGPEDHQGNSSPNGSFRSTALNLSRIFWENDLSSGKSFKSCLDQLRRHDRPEP